MIIELYRTNFILKLFKSIDTILFTLFIAFGFWNIYLRMITKDIPLRVIHF